MGRPKHPAKAGGSNLLLFPTVRRRPWIRRRAATIATFRPAPADAAVCRLIAEHRTRLSKLGFDPDTINADARQLETAIRIELQRARARGDGAA